MSELPKYRVYFNNYYGHSKKKDEFLTESEVNALQYGAKGSKNIYTTCILYPGFEETIKKIVDIRNEICNSLTMSDIKRTTRPYVSDTDKLSQIKTEIYKQGMIILPPTKYFTEEDVIKMNVENIKELTRSYYSYANVNTFIESNHKIPERIKKYLARYLQSQDYLDGRKLYRLLGLIGFMSDEKLNKNLTFGEYLAQNHDNLISQSLNYDFDSIPEEYNDFVINYLHSRNALSFIDRALKKNEAIVHSLTYNEVMKAKEVAISMSPNNYTRNLNNVIQDIRNVENIYTDDEIAEKLSHILIDKAGKLNIPGSSYLTRMQHAVSHVDDFLNNEKTKNATARTVILETIEQNIEQMTMMNIMVLTNTNLSNTVFRSATPDKIVELLSTALSYYDEPIHFVRLITRLFFNQDGHIASYSEWMNYIKDSEKDEKFDLPAGIMISFIVSRDKTRSVRFEPNEYLQDYYKQYAVQEDLTEM